MDRSKASLKQMVWLTMMVGHYAGLKGPVTLTGYHLDSTMGLSTDPTKLRHGRWDSMMAEPTMTVFAIQLVRRWET